MRVQVFAVHRLWICEISKTNILISILSYYLASQLLMKNLTTQPTNSILSSYRNLMKGGSTTK